MSFQISEESEPDLRDDERVCPETGYAHNRFLGECPFVDDHYLPTISVGECEAEFADRRAIQWLFPLVA